MQGTRRTTSLGGACGGTHSRQGITGIHRGKEEKTAEAYRVLVLVYFRPSFRG